MVQWSKQNIANQGSPRLHTTSKKGALYGLEQFSLHL